VRLLLGLGLFQRDDLRLCQHQALLGALGFQRLEPLIHSLQVVAQPHTAHPGGGDREPALQKSLSGFRRHSDGSRKLWRGGSRDGNARVEALGRLKQGTLVGSPEGLCR